MHTIFFTIFLQNTKFHMLSQLSNFVFSKDLVRKFVCMYAFTQYHVPAFVFL